MPTVSPSQAAPGEEITAAKINTPINQLAAAVNALDTNNLADGAVTTPDIADRNVTEAKLTHRPSEYIFDHVASGLVISADSVGVNKNYSITSGVVYLAGIRHTVASVSAQTVAASKDRYIDVRSNGDGTASYITNEVTNNAASQALTSGDLRIGIVVAGATTIATTGSINQGEQDKVLPIASSIPYAVTDSLGNLICPRDPNHRVIGYRQSVSNNTYTTPYATVPGLTCPVIVPTGRKIKITHWARSLSSSAGAGTNSFIAITETSTVLGEGAATAYTANAAVNPSAQAVVTPSAGLHTYLGQSKTDAGTGTIAGAATYPNFIMVELV